MSYISCNLRGPGDPGGVHNFGLGNILFQVATVLSLSNDMDSMSIFPDLNDISKFGGYQDNILHNLDLNGHKPDEIYQEPEFYYTELPKSENITLNGYFQSEKYFLNNRNIILDILSPKNDIKKYLIDKYAYLINKDDVVSIHIRRGDYINLDDYHSVLPIEYYNESLKEFNYNNIVIFSDDINWCKTNLNFNNITFIENEKDYIDMLLMSMIKNNIIANSTFSWWGAWLNNYSDKKVVAPNKWFGIKNSHLNTDDIIPETWIKK